MTKIRNPHSRIAGFWMICSQSVQKTFYSLIHDHRVGEPIAKPMSSALMNRMAHVPMHVAASQWLQWV